MSLVKFCVHFDLCRTLFFIYVIVFCCKFFMVSSFSFQCYFFAYLFKLLGAITAVQMSSQLVIDVIFGVIFCFG